MTLTKEEKEKIKEELKKRFRENNYVGGKAVPHWIEDILNEVFDTSEEVKENK